jgi:hypothetical protein
MITAFLVELFPFHVRAKGITIFQAFGRMAGFFNTFVNPIGIAEAGKFLLALCVHFLPTLTHWHTFNYLGWKYYISYVVFLAYEVVFIYFLFPETSGRSLEELAFCAYYFSSFDCTKLKFSFRSLVYEEDEAKKQKELVAQDLKEGHIGANVSGPAADGKGEESSSQLAKS